MATGSIRSTRPASDCPSRINQDRQVIREETAPSSDLGFQYHAPRVPPTPSLSFYRGPSLPLVYVGVSLSRSPTVETRLSVFELGRDFLVVGEISNKAQTSSAWVTATTPSPWTLYYSGRSLPDFQRSFRKYTLHSTPILQIIPGDVIISINGQPVSTFGGRKHVEQFLNESTELRIVAVRHEAIKREVERILCCSGRGTTVADLEARVASAAYRELSSMLHLLPVPAGYLDQGRLPHHLPDKKPTPTLTRMVTPEKAIDGTCLPPHSVLVNKRTLDEMSLLKTPEPKRARSESPAKLSTASPPNELPSILDSFPEWLAVRKQSWRTKRYKTGPLVYLAMALHRNRAVSPSWGFVISLFERSWLGVGSVSIERNPPWILATDTLPPPRIVRAQTERELQLAFQSLPVSERKSTTRGIVPGDIILAINGKPVSSFGGMSGVAGYLKESSSLHLLIVRDDHARQRVGAEITQRMQGWKSRAHDLAERSHCLLIRRLKTDSALVKLRSELLVNSHHWPLKMPPGQLYGSEAMSSRKVSGILDQASHWYRGPSASRRTYATKSITVLRNPLFRGPNGTQIPYDDESDISPYESMFSAEDTVLVPISTALFIDWIRDRKKTWRAKWRGHNLVHDTDGADFSDPEDEHWDVPAGCEFWTHRGFPSFPHWLAASTKKWKRSFTWNREKMRQIEKACEEVVTFPSLGGVRPALKLQRWLRVRKSQWRLQRRKRRRRSIEEDAFQQEDAASEDVCSGNSRRPELRSLTDLKSESALGDMIVIDALLEEQERRNQEEQRSEPFDISFVFDARRGAPDDVIAYCLSFLPRSEHGKLLCVSTATHTSLRQRGSVWRQLCPSHWILPRRPRKPWHELYITRIRQEETVARKRSDDLIGKVCGILWKGDHLNKIEKLVNDAQAKFSFDVNYMSGVICERNSILNLAVINGRPKTARWLVDEKAADVETSDRGNFTPLINAAWAGDRQLVRFFLSHGSDRTKIGTGHYTEPLASPDFEGLTAEGWAEKKGHYELAELIRLGL